MIDRPTLDLIDTHAHLDDEAFAGEIERLVSEAAGVGVRRIINIGYKPAGWPPALELAARFAGVSYTLGIHPNHAAEATAANLASLRTLLATSAPVAIGEIGLDFYRDWASPEIQRTAFAAQLALAVEFGLPVVIHQRAAESELIAAMRAAPRDLTFILHSFEGSPAYLAAAIERGSPIGVGGLMTRPASGDVRALIAQAPAELLILETDSPYLKPAGVRGSRNVPRNVLTIAKALAQLRGTTVEAIAALTTANAERIFALRPVATTAGGVA